MRIPRYLVVEDCGSVINPAIVDGQIRGGVAQGLGAVLLERAVYDEDGQLVTTTLVDYLLPTASEIPTIEICHIEPEPGSPPTYRGVGEGGAIGAPAALTNAIEDALGALRRDHHRAVPPAGPDPRAGRAAGRAGAPGRARAGGRARPIGRGQAGRERGPMQDVVTAADRRLTYLSGGLWDSSTLPERLAHHAQTRPDAVAVVDATGRYTYAELRRDAAAVCSHLRAAGVAAGEVVSLQLPNRYEAVAAALGVLQLGAVLNPLLPNYRHHELRYVVETARSKAIITPAVYRGFDHRDLVADVRGATATALHHLVVDDGAGGGDATWSDATTPPLLGEDHLPPPRPAEAVSEVIFTSGTEANPKAVMHTEQTTNFSARVAYTFLGLGPEDVVWMPSPVGHSTGFNYGVRFAIYHGPAPRAAGPVERLVGRRADRAGAVQLHPGRHHLPPGSRRRGGRAGRPPRLAPVLRLRGRPRPRRAGRCRRRASASASCGCTDRPRCWWAPGTGPPHPLAKRRLTDGSALTHVEIVDARRRRADRGRGRAGRALRPGAQHLRRILRR